MSSHEPTRKRRYWAVLGLLLLGMAGAAIWMFSRDAGPPEGREEQVEHHAHEEGIAHYTCPMHPSVQQPSPGKCPICGMDLTPVKQEELDSGTIVVDEVRRQQLGVRTAAAERRNVSRQIRAVGQVKVDETRLSDVNLRMSGWVHRLHVEETGQRVKRGQVLFTLYSPELYAAEREYLTALERSREAPSNTGAELTRASEQRLRLLGMSQAQIGALARRGEAWENVPVLAPSTGYVIDKDVVEGGRIEAGTRVYRIADLSRLWVNADVYESDLAQVKKGQPVSVHLPYVPGQRFEGRVDYVYPTLDGVTRTGRVRVALDNPDLALRPDMYADVELAVDLGERLVIPDSAVIYTGPRRLVFVDLGEGKLRPQEIQVGVRAGDYVEVTRGLEPGDVVVTSGNFLIAAESRIRSATGYWGGGHGAH
ncbi:MAG: efflux RND transporter periplasmic adaptor subunit [Deltaproteobacteria bacterium]|nr:efflux RND transporter periplasmic adaptor subunit [Deltaproteobacteria bacterium]NNK07866.1 efflux RND transporter periplasmic adaptor subunit [Myxococcales bacterium]MBT8464016.1 efflux RND transporter periplasmic adaptor subunit [Deltaproteobacteria bacterium]MBT8481565.1 efflux RND transporter periplasmic adaptor subunit [Deltaproteobacteria bacterium]NNK43521.1 efflux RND transporter periplasmic adaptor subunit [Myxococcales bacterium]